MKTYSPTPEDVKNDWIVVDATDKILGRLATEIANRLRGKHKPEYSHHMGHGRFRGCDQCRKDQGHRREAG